jgi:hypothetical protein
VVKPTEVSAQVGSTVTFSVAPTQPPLKGNLVVSVVSNKPTVATVNLPTLTFPEGNTAPQVITVTGVGVGVSTITIERAATTTATNYPATIASKTVKATITAGPPVAPKTIFVAPNGPGDGSSPVSPANFQNAFTAAKTLQQATPNLPVILKVVSGSNNSENIAGIGSELIAINNGTITIQPEPNAAGGLAGVQLPANFTIGSAVTVNDIKIDIPNNGQLTIEGDASKLKINLGNTGQLIIKGNASKLIVKDSNSNNIEKVTVDAGATVTDSTIILNRGGVANNASDQLIVKGILKNSTVVANENEAKAAIIKLAGKLDSVTFSCKIETSANGDGVCIEATAAGAQIINSKVDFDVPTATGPTPRVVDAGDGVTIIGSELTRIANPGVKVFAVNHGGGALVIQNSTIDLGALDHMTSANDDTRAVNSNAASGSIILTGNSFRGYNRNFRFVVEIGPGLGATPQQIANNQFQITNPSTVGIRSNNAPDTLAEQYANLSGNTFGSANTRVKKQ